MEGRLFLRCLTKPRNRNMKMKSNFLLFLIVMIFTSCHSGDPQNGKSRKELLDEIPYRGEVISDEVNNEIIKYLRIAIKEIKSLDEVSILYADDDGKINFIDGQWKNGEEALKTANELWRKENIKMTIVAYPSYSRNVETNKSKDMWVIEVHHESVTRTCRMFFNENQPTKLTTLEC